MIYLLFSVLEFAPTTFSFDHDRISKRRIFWHNFYHQLSTTSFPLFCISCLPACTPISFPRPAPWLPSALLHFYCTLPPPPGWGAWRPDFCIFVPGLGSCMPPAPLLASPHLHPLIISVIISVITIGLKLECRQCTVRWRPWEMLGIASLLWPSHQDNFLSSSSESSWENCLTHYPDTFGRLRTLFCHHHQSHLERIASLPWPSHQNTFHYHSHHHWLHRSRTRTQRHIHHHC